MLKFMIHSFWIKYDMVWALSIILVDWKKWVDYVKNWPKKLQVRDLKSLENFKKMVKDFK